MATTITLGKPPKSFKRTVTFPMLQGGEGKITCEFKYRTRKAFGQFIDKIAAEAGVDGKTDEGVFSMEKLMSGTIEQNATYLLDVLEGWDLDVALSRDALEQLADEVPAAAAAIMKTYRDAVVEGRLGN